jgi:transposase
MVAAVRSGSSQRSVAERFKTSLCTVQRWIAHAAGKRLDRVDFSDRSHEAHRIANKTTDTVEQRILQLREELKRSILGEHGAEAIAAELAVEGHSSIPSVRTINRILQRVGAFDGDRRVRRPAPKPGWYLPAVAVGEAELDEIDIVEGLILKDGPEVQVLNLMSLHGGRPGSFVAERFTAKSTIGHLLAHWKAVGRPAYAQFDNDTRFHGPHQFPDVIGRVSRLCMALNIIPVFAAPREHGPQNAVESFNYRWQAYVWARYLYGSIAELRTASDRYIAACCQKHARRIDAAPDRRALDDDWQFDPRQISNGQIIYLRRTDAKGAVSVLGQNVPVDPQWVHRLVRCELDLKRQLLSVFALRRSAPDDQRLLLQKKHPMRLKPLRD